MHDWRLRLLYGVCEQWLIDTVYLCIHGAFSAVDFLCSSCGAGYGMVGRSTIGNGTGVIGICGGCFDTLPYDATTMHRMDWTGLELG